MSTAFLIGNGLSRKSIDLTKLDGVTYGCNAVYRDLDVDYLIIADKKMLQEVIESKKITDYKNVYTQKGYVKEFEKQNIVFNSMATAQFVPGSIDSGYAAFRLALHHTENKTIYFLGYDFTYSTPDNLPNNIYSGSKNYTHDLRNHRMKSSVIKLIAKDCKLYKDRNFIRVIDPELSFDWARCFRATFRKLPKPSNYKEITVEEFKCQLLS